MTQSPNLLYPNRDDDRVGHDAVSRRHLLTSGATAGAVATAGCAGDGDSEASDDTQSQATEHPTVFVFNIGDGTVSLIDPASNEVVGSRAIGLSSSFPSNQYTPDLTDGSEDVLWLNVEHGVRALTVGTLDEVARVDTGSGANWQEQTPDGDHLVVSAQEPSHMNYRIDADRRSATVGEVVGIDHAAGEIIERIDVGSSPYGTTAGTVRSRPIRHRRWGSPSHASGLRRRRLRQPTVSRTVRAGTRWRPISDDHRAWNHSQQSELTERVVWQSNDYVVSWFADRFLFAGWPREIRLAWGWEYDFILAC